MPNFKAAISKHNFTILNQETTPQPPKCNCRKSEECPLPGRCTTENVVYRATVTANSSVEKYVGLTAMKFKDRFSKHKSDIEQQKNRTNTTLAGHMWDLKDKNLNYQIKWEIVCRAAPFSPISKKCNQCLAEKYV